MSALNPLGSNTAWNLVSSGYAQNIEPFLAKFAEDAIQLAQLAPTDRVLDVACGPGTLCLRAAPHVQSVMAVDFAGEMLAQLQVRQAANGSANVTRLEADGQALPLEGNQFDKAFSMFGLMFFPDRPQGFRELHRTLRPGGRALVASWAPTERAPMMLALFGALEAAKPGCTQRPPGSKGLEDLEVFERELQQAGFGEIQIHPVEHRFPKQDPHEFWTSMVNGSAPMALLRRNTPSEEWAEMEVRALEYLRDCHSTALRDLTSMAYIATAIKPTD
ncbi:MAG: ubiquinone/menaquinone biosynthesis C-methylase UbiE [Planctomycetota bacterium]|jgi:ubiquinone/menaquinone biosynthesis C-methylase UbiE